MESTSGRFTVVDALRGFAIVSIILLHHIEHFDFYFFPEEIPSWLKSVDKGIWDTLFFLFGGKSYAIFALLCFLVLPSMFNSKDKKCSAAILDLDLHGVCFFYLALE